MLRLFKILYQQKITVLFICIVILSGLSITTDATAGTGYIDSQGKWHFSVLCINLTLADTTAWRMVLNKANDFLYYSTNSKFQFGTVRMVLRSCTAISPDICYDPLADIIIYNDEDISFADVYGTNRLGYHVFMANELLAITPFPDLAAKHVVHELGHYLMAFYDEYRNENGDDLGMQQCIYSTYRGLPVDRDACFMEDIDANTQMWCYNENHEVETVMTQHMLTWQSQDNNNESCWSTMKRVYAPRMFFMPAEPPQHPGMITTSPPSPSYIHAAPIKKLVVAVDAFIANGSCEEQAMFEILERAFASDPGPNSNVIFVSYHDGRGLIQQAAPWDAGLLAAGTGTNLMYQDWLDALRSSRTPTHTADIDVLLQDVISSNLFSPMEDSRTLLIITSGQVDPLAAPTTGSLTSFRSQQIRTTIAFVRPTNSTTICGGSIVQATTVEMYADVADSIAGTIYDATIPNVVAFQSGDIANKQLVCVETRLISGGNTESFEYTLPAFSKESLVSVDWPDRDTCNVDVVIDGMSVDASISTDIVLPSLKARRYGALDAGSRIEVLVTVPMGCEPSMLPVTFAISDERPNVFLTATSERPQYGFDDRKVVHGRVTNPHPLINVNIVAAEIDTLGEFLDIPSALADTGEVDFGDWVKGDGIYSTFFENPSASGLRTVRVRATHTSQTKLALGEKFSNNPSNAIIPGSRREAFTTYYVKPQLNTTLSQSLQFDQPPVPQAPKDTLNLTGRFSLTPEYPHAQSITGTITVNGGPTKFPMKIDANTFQARVPVSKGDDLAAELTILYRTGDMQIVSANYINVGVKESTRDGYNLPKEFRLHLNYPNPFNIETRFVVEVPQQSPISLAIFDITGRTIRTLIAEKSFEPGRHEIIWDGRSDDGAVAGSGVYFVRLRAANQQQVLKILLMK